MASNTMMTSNRRKRTHQNQGRKRKHRDARGSTPSAEELFLALGEPGKPAPPASQGR